MYLAHVVIDAAAGHELEHYAQVWSPRACANELHHVLMPYFPHYCHLLQANAACHRRWGSREWIEYVTPCCSHVAQEWPQSTPSHVPEVYKRQERHSHNRIQKGCNVELPELWQPTKSLLQRCVLFFSEGEIGMIPHLEELLILLRVCVHVSEDFDGHFLPTVAALVQVPKGPRGYFVLEGYVCWIKLPVVRWRC